VTSCWIVGARRLSHGWATAAPPALAAVGLPMLPPASAMRNPGLRPAPSNTELQGIDGDISMVGEASPCTAAAGTAPPTAVLPAVGVRATWPGAAAVLGAAPPGCTGMSLRRARAASCKVSESVLNCATVCGDIAGTAFTVALLAAALGAPRGA